MLKNPKKILIVNIFGIGDVLFTTPIISNLKLQFPNIQIGYICNRRTECILKNNKKIDKVFVYERDEFAAARKKSLNQFFRLFFEMLSGIKKEKYDAVLDVSLSGFMSFLCFLAGIKVRIGYNYKGRGFFLNHKILLKGYENKHVVEHYLELLNALGIKAKDKHLELFLSKEDISWADNFFKTNSINSKFVIGIVPGGGGSWGKDAIYKQWPHENYAKLADKLFEKFRASLILFGDKNEIELCKKTAGLMKSKAILACGNTTISQFAALSRKCSLNILNDGGPLHIAAASGAKTISIFGPVDEEVYGPYPKENHEVVTSSVACRPCYRRFRRSYCDHISCLKNISVEEVLKKIEKFI